MSSTRLLDVQGLTTQFRSGEHIVTAVDNVSFFLQEGEILGIVGESGCGKSVTSLSIMRLIASPAGKIASGRVLFEGRDLLSLSEREMQAVRGNTLSMIFQEPMTSLNPVFTIGEQIAEVLRVHGRMSGKEARIQAIQLLEQVRIPSPALRAQEYPHQMSGGMRQRVMIAMALACSPRLLIADEPTTALDVTIQGQILDELGELRRERGTAVMLITHDLGVVAAAAQRVVVMYAGQVVEQADVTSLFADPMHPYTVGLMRSVPTLSSSLSGPRKPLPTIEGVVPALHALPSGCRFHDRCPHVFSRCKQEVPSLFGPSGHEVRCWLYAQ